MKISTNNFFKDYIEGLKTSININLEEIFQLNKSKDYLFNSIEPYKDYLLNFTNIDIESIKTITRQIPEKAIIIRVFQLGLDLNILVFKINSIITINKNIENLEKKNEKLKSLFIKKNIFKCIINKFNIKISDRIIEKGYSYFLGFGLSKIRIKKIKCDTRKKKRINWFESNKTRKEIEARGGIPYAVTERDYLKHKLADNGGEEWFTYFTAPFDFLWFWNKRYCTVINSEYYKFKPTCYNNITKGGILGNVNRLKKLVLNDNELIKNYTE